MLPLRYSRNTNANDGEAKAKELLIRVGLKSGFTHMPKSNVRRANSEGWLLPGNLLINNPDILLADEPSNGKFRDAMIDQIMELLTELNRRANDSDGDSRR